AFPLVIDATAPIAPDNLAGWEGIGDPVENGLTTQRTLIFSGTSEPNSTVELFIDGISIGTVTAYANGNWTFDHTGTPLADGSYVITSQAPDAAGNVSPLSAGLSLQVDATAPLAPSNLGVSNDTGPSASDRITQDRTLAFSGTSEPDAI